MTDTTTREYLTKLILCDVLDSIEAIYGTKGLNKVTEHARKINKSREDNDAIDKLEELFERIR